MLVLVCYLSTFVIVCLVVLCVDMAHLCVWCVFVFCVCVGVGGGLSVCVCVCVCVCVFAYIHYVCV